MFDDRDIRRLVGDVTLDRGRKYWLSGQVSTLRWTEDRRRVAAQITGSARHAYSTEVVFESATSVLGRPLGGDCSCPVGFNCKHVAALLFAVLAEQRRSGQGHPVTPAPAWERTLAGLELDQLDDGIGSRTRTLGLQFEVMLPKAGISASSRFGSAPVTSAGMRLGTRAVALSDTGRWVRTGASWRELDYARYGNAFPAGQLNWFREFRRLSFDQDRYYGAADSWVYLDDYRSELLWAHLEQARPLGIPFFHSGKTAPPVTLHDETASATLLVSRNDSGLELNPSIEVGNAQFEADQFGFIGNPAHGIYLVESDDRADARAPESPRVKLIQLDAPLPTGLVSWLRQPKALRIPAAEVPIFIADHLPQLRRHLTVTSPDGSFEIPNLPQPTLVLTITHTRERRIELVWGWSYEEQTDAPLTSQPRPLRPTDGERAYRDELAEQEVVTRLGLPFDSYPSLEESANGARRLSSRAILSGMSMVTFLAEEVPRIQALPGLRVETVGEVTDYHEASEEAVITVGTTAHEGERDWFDLAVEITVDGEEVPFDLLFVALATEQQYLILPSGTYFALDDSRFARLKALIEEARSLGGDGESLTIGRYQAGLWDELQKLGIVTEQADAWQRLVGALVDTDRIEVQPAPPNFQATLRPYQQEGFDWLSFLYRHGLGGVLADDMGLGKTLQALALIASERADAASPFLVVAPTSVVGNWATEAARFTPGLRVVVIDSTSGRRGIALDELVADADLVVTSYALFRIEFDSYDALDWCGLILDEAQFVKNHQSNAYQCARRLGAPFKLAITGTPLENNLMELWSMFSIVAPGLFAGPTFFADYYRKPIENSGNAELLAQLRRRIRPLMLRRTKEQVAADLPAKQEQVLEVELNPRHRRVYDTYLQRERQKVLGLLGDLDANRFQIFRSLTLLRQASLDVSLVDEKHAGVAATKVDVLFELLDDVIAEGHRTLIFSQFTGFLGHVRDGLKTRGIDYDYLDGKTRNRTGVIERFRTGTAPVFLISLKSGGFGLNLTEADYCILLDPWWNPATEMQAVDRVHRIGQTRNVVVYRLVAKDTIEEKVMALKESKAKLFASVMADDGGTSGSKLTAADIRSLLS